MPAALQRANALSVSTGSLIGKAIGTLALFYIRYLAKGYLEGIDVLICLLVGACVDYSRPLLLKNYYFLYVFFLFGVGGGFFFPDLFWLQRDFLFFLIAFGVGYTVIFVFPGKKRAAPGTGTRIHLYSFNFIVLMAAVFKLIAVAYNIKTYGLSGYLAGDAIADTIRNYGSRDVGRGILTVFSEAAKILTMAAVCIHIRTQFRLKQDFNYKLLAFLLVVLPLVSMERTFTAWGVMVIGVMYSFQHYKEGKFRQRDYVIFSVLAVIFLAFILLIGSIRVKNMTEGQGNYTGSVFFIGAVTGEFQNVLVYKVINDEIDSDNIDYTYGKTIFGPLIFKIIPRSLFPDKPINSGATISQLIQPSAYEAGFMLPAAYFGDLYLNFGIVGCIIGCLVLGSVCRFLDFNYINKNQYYLPHFVVFYYYFYPLVRNDISNSISLLFFVAIAVWVLERFMKPVEAPLAAAEVSAVLPVNHLPV